MLIDGPLSRNVKLRHGRLDILRLQLAGYHGEADITGSTKGLER
jgi:hypothetical protein